MFDKLGSLVAHHPRKTLLAWIILALVLWYVAPPLEQRCQDDDVRFLPSRCLSIQGYNLYKQAFPQDIFGSKVVFAFEREDAELTPADFALIDRVIQEIEEVRRNEPGWLLGTISSYRDAFTGARLKSADGRCTLVMVAMETPFLAFRTGDAVTYLEERLRPLIEEHGRNGPRLHLAVTGASGIGRDINYAAYRSLDDTTLATLVLVVVILLLVYRSPLLALVPLATIGGSVWISLRCLALLSLCPDFQIVNITRIFVVVVLYGAGTDYCLFLISRYREEMQNEHDPAEAIRHTLGRVGGALTASAGTVVCGLGMMGFAEFAKLRYTGPAIALSLIVALAASLTFAPAVLRLMGTWAFWPRCMPCPGSGRASRLRLAGPGAPGPCESRLWTWFSERIAATPCRIWIGCVAILVPLAILGYRTRHTHDFCAELPCDSQSRQGLDMIRRHFTAGELGPLTVLLRSGTDWDGQDQQATIAGLSQELAAIDNVAEVRSLTQPLGVPVRAAENQRSGIVSTLSLVKAFGVNDFLGYQAARSHYVSRVPDSHVTRLDVIFKTDPFSEESVHTLHAVQRKLAERFPGEEPGYALYGITAFAFDLAAVHESDRVLVNCLVLAGILLILIVLIRKPLLSLYLLLTVLFSYYVTIGATELLSLGWLDPHLGKVDWKVPYFLFTILVAIGEDYNIFLIARVLEESRRHGMHTGTRLALARTGSTITSCGLIMAGTFATMMLCSLTTLVQLGLALAFGVLLDTFLVRPILVPAFLLMMHRKEADEPPAEERSPPEQHVLRRSA